MKQFDEALYVAEMYRDSYYPDFLVDQVKAALAGAVACLQAGPHSPQEIQAKFDEAMRAINNLQEAFYKSGSEIETVARDSIGETVIHIIEHFGLDLDVETAMMERDW